MDPEIALQFAVCENPGDDLPRLVYADWLDENDQPDRAAFIRAQVELATLTGDSPRRRELAFRARELFDRHGDEWSPSEQLCPERRFARGFLEAVTMTAGDLDEHGTVLFALNPIRRLSLTAMGGDVGCLRRSTSLLGRLTALDLTGNDLDVVALEELVGLGEHFSGLRELGLMFNRLDDEAAGVLCDRPFFQRLSRLRLGANPFTDAGRQRLRDHFGNRVTFECERDDDYLYAILGHNFQTGFGNDYQQFLFMERRDGTWLASFDHAGNLLRAEIRKYPDGTTWVPNNRLREELGFQPATIQVKRFKFPDGIGIEAFDPLLIEDFDNPASDEIENAREWLQHWLGQGMFRWTWVGDDYWLNREGEVTDT
jgi:uncharacterized protein (TIGR02996 family)